MGTAMSGRRGVHHSGGLRAKRRWLRWRRYQRRCEALAGYVDPGDRWFLPDRPYHPHLRGFVTAYARWAHAGRYAPIGIRDVRP